MSNYRKLVAAIVGVTLILLKQFTGIELPGLGDQIIEIAMAIGTWVALWWFPNTVAADASSAAGAADIATGTPRSNGAGRAAR